MGTVKLVLQWTLLFDIICQRREPLEVPLQGRFRSSEGMAGQTGDALKWLHDQHCLDPQRGFSNYAELYRAIRISALPDRIRFDFNGSFKGVPLFTRRIKFFDGQGGEVTASVVC